MSSLLQLYTSNFSFIHYLNLEIFRSRINCYFSYIALRIPLLALSYINKTSHSSPLVWMTLRPCIVWPSGVTGHVAVNPAIMDCLVTFIFHSHLNIRAEIYLFTLIFFQSNSVFFYQERYPLVASIFICFWWIVKLELKWLSVKKINYHPLKDCFHFVYNNIIRSLTMPQ